MTMDDGARAFTREEEPVREVDYGENEVDRILDKISEKGIHSLSDRERSILEQARKNMGR